VTNSVVSVNWQGLIVSCKTLCIVIAPAVISGCVLEGVGSGNNSSGLLGFNGPVVDISWSPDPNGVEGYSIYYGSTAETVVNYYGDFTVAAGQVDPFNPRVQISAYYDLGLRDGEQVCLSIQAFNSFGASNLSMPVCATVN